MDGLHFIRLSKNRWVLHFLMVFSICVVQNRTLSIFMHMSFSFDDNSTVPSPIFSVGGFVMI